jgi:hypothetical protein
MMPRKELLPRKEIKTAQEILEEEEAMEKALDEVIEEDWEEPEEDLND